MVYSYRKRVGFLANIDITVAVWDDLRRRIAVNIIGRGNFIFLQYFSPSVIKKKFALILDAGVNKTLMVFWNEKGLLTSGSMILCYTATVIEVHKGSRKSVGVIRKNPSPAKPWYHVLMYSLVSDVAKARFS